jgi:hypothetical protein
MDAQLGQLLGIIIALDPKTLSDFDLRNLERILNIGANLEYKERMRRASLNIETANQHDTCKDT